MASADMPEKRGLEVDVSTEVVEAPPSDAVPVERVESPGWKKLVYTLIALTPFVGAPAASPADDGGTNTPRASKKAGEYTQEEKKAWLEKLNRMTDDEYKKSLDPLFKGRTNRDAERFGLDPRYEKIFPDELKESEWTKYGKVSSSTDTQVFVFKVRVKTKDGKVMQSKKFYKLGFNKHASIAEENNPYGISTSSVLDADAEVSSYIVEESFKRNESSLDQKGKFTLEEIANGNASKVASREK